MTPDEPKNATERLSRLQEQRAQDEAALRARRAEHKAVPQKAGEPNDHRRYDVTPADMEAIRQRHIDTAESRSDAQTVRRVLDAQHHRANPHALPPKRPFSDYGKDTPNRWPR